MQAFPHDGFANIRTLHPRCAFVYLVVWRALTSLFCFRIVSRGGGGAGAGGGRCTAIEEALTHDNAMNTLAGVDLVVDASDNPRTRYLVNDACVLSGTPLVGCRSFYLFSISVLLLLVRAVTCCKDFLLVNEFWLLAALGDRNVCINTFLSLPRGEREKAARDDAIKDMLEIEVWGTPYTLDTLRSYIEDSSHVPSRRSISTANYTREKI